MKKNKRTIKNIILTVVIVLCLGSMYLTMNYIKNNTETTTETTNNMQMNNNQSAPSMPGNNDSSNERPEMPEGNTTNNEGQTPPEKPDGNTTNSEGQTPPEKPSDEKNEANTNGSDNTESTNDASQTETSENPQGNNNGNGNGMNGNPPSMPNEVKSTTIPTIYYFIFGIESLVLASAIIYLIMSNFNKKKIKETFVNKDKITIAVLSVILLGTILTVADTLVTTKYFLNNSKKTNEQNSTTTTNTASYSAKTEITENKDLTEGTYESTTKDENAISVSGDVTSTLSNITVTKTGDSDGGDNTSFYGTNSAIIAKDGANVTIKDATIETNATGANGVFSYGGSATTNNSSSDGTTVTISDSKITTTKDNSGGIMTTGGGIMNATNLTINTAGTSSAAIRTDRGGGTVTVNKGTYTTTGQGSPTIYSTANVTVNDAKLVSKASEGIVIEGKNSVTINNCELTDTNSKLNGQSTTYKNIFLYQSMSGDAATGQAEFTATDSKITTKKGDSFYVTNTTATINLENNTIKNTDSTGNFLRVQKDSWGNTGSNGGDVTLNMTNQKATGNIVIDSISTLTMNMKSSSSYEGAINQDNTAKAITLKLDKSSKIKLTADSYVTSLEDEDEDYSNINFNGYKLYVNGKAIN